MENNPFRCQILCKITILNIKTFVLDFLNTFFSKTYLAFFHSGMGVLLQSEILNGHACPYIVFFFAFPGADIHREDLTLHLSLSSQASLVSKPSNFIILA